MEVDGDEEQHLSKTDPVDALSTEVYYRTYSLFISPIFANFKAKRGRNGSKKTENLFFNRVSELYFPAINGLGQLSC
jgi:hypothetical protein